MCVFYTFSLSLALIRILLFNSNYLRSFSFISKKFELNWFSFLNCSLLYNFYWPHRPKKCIWNNNYCIVLSNPLYSTDWPKTWNPFWSARYLTLTFLPSGLWYEYEPSLTMTYSHPSLVDSKEPCSATCVPSLSENLNKLCCVRLTLNHKKFCKDLNVE